MRRLLIIVLPALLACCKPDTRKEISGADTSLPSIERLSPELDALIDKTAKIEVIAEGFEWAEGPLWVEGVGLLFSDIPPNKVYKWTQEGGTALYLNHSGYTGNRPRGGEKGSNGLLLDLDGNLVLCQHGDRRIAKMNAPLSDPQPDFITIVASFEDKKFNSPNDACYSTRGDLYFSDPPYGLENKMEDTLKQLDYQGVFQYSSTGKLTLLTKELSRPNGIALSPDERTLYVANSDPQKAIWMAYTLDEQGMIISEKLFHDATNLVGKEKGLPDGLKVDAKGNVFATGPGGVWIFNDSGKVLGKIRTGQATANCAFGNNGKTLFITADMYVMSVALKQ